MQFKTYSLSSEKKEFALLRFRKHGGQYNGQVLKCHIGCVRDNYRGAGDRRAGKSCANVRDCGYRIYIYALNLSIFIVLLYRLLGCAFV